MKKSFALFFAFVLGINAWADIPNGYYYNAVGKHDEELMSSLEGIIYDHTTLGYNELWDCYPSTDMGDDGYYICGHIDAHDSQWHSVLYALC